MKSNSADSMESVECGLEDEAGSAYDVDWSEEPEGEEQETTSPEVRRFKVTASEAGGRLDLGLSELMSCSRSRVQKLIKSGKVTCLGKVIDSGSCRLEQGQVLQVELPPLVPAVPLPDPDVLLDIVYEDDSIVVVNKQRGLIVHPGAGVTSGTLVNGLLAHCHDLSGIGGVERPGIVHRLDKDTSGLLVVSKNDAAHLSLSEQFAQRQVTKYYLALVYGVPESAHGLIEQPIGRHPSDRKRMAVCSRGRTAKTEYQVLESFLAKYAWLKIHLFTGRTHQIRVHLAWIGHPLVGDLLYKPRKNPWNLEGQALHCNYLSFRHPKTGAVLEFTAPVPTVLQNILTDLGAKG